jgi:glycosyltransferase involved in cell wall biosynthesis
VSDRSAFTLAVAEPAFGHHHVARLRAVAAAAPWPGVRVVGLEVFARDSDYAWAPGTAAGAGYEHRRVTELTSDDGRRRPWRLGRALAAALAELRPDAVVVKGWGHRESQLLLSWARRCRCPWVLACDSSEGDARRVWLKETVKRFVIRGTRAAWVAGSPQAAYVARLGVPAAAVFHPGSCVVDNDFWQRESDGARQRAAALRVELGLPPRYFLAVARFISKKNLGILLRAFARYRAADDSHGLVLCGAGPEEVRLRALAAQLGVAAAVVFAGFRQTTELPAYYGLATALVLPSVRYEQWGMVVNEAMAAGLPVVVSRACGCAGDLVEEGGNGFAVDPADPERLAVVLAHLAAAPAEELARMGEASRRIVAGHTPTVAAANLWRAVAVATGRDLGGAFPPPRAPR